MAIIFSPSEIEEAVKLVLKGEIIAYPTETFYGLGANALDEEAVKKIFLIKERPLYKPLPILIPDKQWLEKIVEEIPLIAQNLIAHFWPGPLTLVFKAKNILPSSLTAGTKKIAIRISNHPIAQELVKKLECPLTTTSANLFDKPPPASVQEIDSKIKAKIAAIINGGKTAGKLASTIIDVTVNPPRCLRKGAIELEHIKSKGFQIDG